MESNMAYKLAFLFSGVASVLYFMIQELQQDGVEFTTGIFIILAIVACAVGFFSWLYLKDVDENGRKKLSK